MKIVINVCFGGFSISKEAAEYMAAHGSDVAKAELADWHRDNEAVQTFLSTGQWPESMCESSRGSLAIDAKYHRAPTFHGFGYSGNHNGYNRSDLLLVEAVEKLGTAANGECAKLRVVEIPDGVEWEIDEYDGNEHIAEKHRTWS